MVPSARIAIVACAILSVGSFAGAASEAMEAVARGEFLYRMHCAACHGRAGQGDGPVAGELKTAPSDLTRLRDDAEGFADKRARRFIDGRDGVASHGSREMPIWGLTFQDRGRPGQQEDEVAGRIDDLVEYLHSIQRD